MDDLTQLIDDIYAALLEPERRDDVLKSIVNQTGGDNGIWFVPHLQDFNNSFLGFTLPEEILRPWFEHYHAVDSWHAAAKFHSVGSVMNLTESYLRRHQGNDEMYNDYCLPTLEAAGMSALRLGDHGDLNSTVAIYRCPGRPDATAEQLRILEILSPHLQRFSQLYSRLAEADQHQHRFSDFLDGLGRGIVLTDPTGRIHFANTAALEVLERRDGLSDFGGVLRLASRSDSLNLINIIRDTALGLNPILVVREQPLTS